MFVISLVAHLAASNPNILHTKRKEVLQLLVQNFQAFCTNNQIYLLASQIFKKNATHLSCSGFTKYRQRASFTTEHFTDILRSLFKLLLYSIAIYKNCFHRKNVYTTKPGKLNRLYMFENNFQSQSNSYYGSTSKTMVAGWGTNLCCSASQYWLYLEFVDVSSYNY